MTYHVHIPNGVQQASELEDISKAVRSPNRHGATKQLCQLQL